MWKYRVNLKKTNNKHSMYENNESQNHKGRNEIHAIYFRYLNYYAHSLFQILSKPHKNKI